MIGKKQERIFGRRFMKPGNRFCFAMRASRGMTISA